MFISDILPGYYFSMSCVLILFWSFFCHCLRFRYFDNYGIIRDIMQNHLLQILALFAMETLVSLDAEDIRIEKVLQLIFSYGCELSTELFLLCYYYHCHYNLTSCSRYYDNWGVWSRAKVTSYKWSWVKRKSLFGTCTSMKFLRDILTLIFISGWL